MKFRIKVVAFDCHYFYADSMNRALEIMQELSNLLEECDHQIYLYVETPYGHIRIK